MVEALNKKRLLVEVEKSEVRSMIIQPYKKRERIVHATVIEVGSEVTEAVVGERISMYNVGIVLNDNILHRIIEEKHIIM